MQQIHTPRGAVWRRAAALAAGLLLFAAIPASAASTTWTVEAGTANAKTGLDAVSCPTSKFCAAVGANGKNSTTSKTYAESWDGTTWSAAPSAGPKASWLFDVSCVAPDWCQSVGWSANATHPLIEHWDGHAWSQTASPMQGKQGPLRGVSCSSRTWCVAVGGQGGAPNELLTMIEQWDGTAWKLVSSPSKGKTESILNSVSCVSKKWCTAVGTTYQAGFSSSRTLVERWEGHGWRILPSQNPTPAGQIVTLAGIDCVSTKVCIAVGRAETGAVIERWNGTTWRLMTHPSANRPYADLGRVSCVSAKACVAVGSDANGALAEAWNGKAWSPVALPRGPGAPRGLTDVSCATATLCKATGPGNVIETSS